MQAHHYQIRKEAIACWKAGEKKSDISRKLGISYHSLLSWIKRHQAEGEDGIVPHYDRSGRHSEMSQEVEDKIKACRKTHEDWGGAYIRLNVGRDLPELFVPGERQIQRMLVKSGQARKPTRQPGVPVEWARHVFERVQADAKERLRTKNGKECCYLNFIDEHSGAELDALVFPLRTYLPGSGTGNFRCATLLAVAMGLHPLLSHGQRAALWRPHHSVTHPAQPVPESFGHCRQIEPQALPS